MDKCSHKHLKIVNEKHEEDATKIHLDNINQAIQSLQLQITHEFDKDMNNYK